MKRLLFLLMVGTTSFVSCSKEDAEMHNEQLNDSNLPPSVHSRQSTGIVDKK